MAIDRRLSPNDGVAVVIPAYNAARTLRETLESAISQESATEIVVVDDGSSDGTLALAQTFAPRVIALSGPTLGVSAARNAGAQATSAPWLLFLDSDDLLNSGTVIERLGAARRTGADVIVCDWRAFNDGGPTVGSPCKLDWETFLPNPEVAIARIAWAPTAAILYNRSIFERTGGFREDLPVIQDARLFFDAAFAEAKFAHAPHFGARYRVRADSLSRGDPIRFLLDVLRNGQQIEALWRARGILTSEQWKALSEIYNQTTTGLFSAGHNAYYEAAECRRRLAIPLSPRDALRGRVAASIGLTAASHLFTFGRNVKSLVKP